MRWFRALNVDASEHVYVEKRPEKYNPKKSVSFTAFKSCGTQECPRTTDEQVSKSPPVMGKLTASCGIIKCEPLRVLNSPTAVRPPGCETGLSILSVCLVR